MSKHQYAMVMDLNKCLGCQTCTIACKKLWTDRDGTEHMYWNNVETRPGLGYPRQWDRIGGGWKDGQLYPSELPSLDDYGHPFEYNYEERLYQGGKKPVMPSPNPQSGVNWDEDVGSVNGDENYYFYVPRICNHCTYPACLEACPRKAIYKREEDGIVVLDQERCRGYRYCIKACPYKKIYFNESPANRRSVSSAIPVWKKARSMPAPSNALAGYALSVYWTTRNHRYPNLCMYTASPCHCFPRKGPSPMSSMFLRLTHPSAEIMERASSKTLACRSITWFICLARE